ncbi:radical SAM protein [bacterium]|nr:radical SAM protein [bacterium]
MGPLITLWRCWHVRSNWRDLISSHTLVVTSFCSLRCIHCKLWRDYPLEMQDRDSPSRLRQLIETGRFFEFYPRTRLYNIIGGDPFCMPELAALLATLKQAGIYIRLWTNARASDDHWDSIIPFVDEVAVYIPIPDPTEYREYTGYDGWSSLTVRLARFKEQKIPISIYTLATPVTIEWLPYVHDIARQYNAPLMVNYYTFDEFSPDELAHIWRYNWVTKTIAVPLKRRHKISCPAVPYEMFQVPRYFGRVWAKQWVDWGRRMLN